jgi:hypothetical protein
MFNGITAPRSQDLHTCSLAECEGTNEHCEVAYKQALMIFFFCPLAGYLSLAPLQCIQVLRP